MGNAIFRATDAFGTPTASAVDALHSPVAPVPDTCATPGASPLPAELTQKIGRQLGGRDRLNFALACQAHRTALASELLSGSLTQQVKNTRSLSAFQALIGNPGDAGGAQTHSITELPTGLRVDPLLALSRNIMALPLAEQAAASLTWRTAALPIASRCPSLQRELAEQARSTQLADRTAEVNSLDDYRIFLGLLEGGASDTINTLRADLRVKPIVALASRIARLPLQDMPEATRLFLLAVGKIDDDFRTGLDKLERAARAASGPEELSALAPVHAVKSGEAAHDVIRRAGITNAVHIRMLGYLEWGVAVKNGESIEHAAIRYGIVDGGQLSEAIRTASRFAISFGEPLLSVITTYAITDAEHIAALTELALHEARGALQNGGAALPLVIARYGITEPEHISGLGHFVLERARQAIRGGDALEAVITRFGLTADAHVADLTRLHDEVEARRDAEEMGAMLTLCQIM